jgi:hypothetical protein
VGAGLVGSRESWASGSVGDPVRSVGLSLLGSRERDLGVGDPVGGPVCWLRERERASSASDFRSVGEGTVERGRFGKWGEILE